MLKFHFFGKSILSIMREIYVKFDYTAADSFLNKFCLFPILIYILQRVYRWYIHNKL